MAKRDNNSCERDNPPHESDKNNHQHDNPPHEHNKKQHYVEMLVLLVFPLLFLIPRTIVLCSLLGAIALILSISCAIFKVCMMKGCLKWQKA